MYIIDSLAQAKMVADRERMRNNNVPALLETINVIVKYVPIINGICDVHTNLKETRVEQTYIVIDNYTEDIKTLMYEKPFKNRDDLRSIFSNTEFTYLENIDGAKSEIEALYEDDEFTALVFATKGRIIKSNEIVLPTGNRLRNRDTYLLLDTSNSLPNTGIPNKNIKHDTLVITSDSTWFVRDSFNMRATVREFDANELFNSDLIDYSKIVKVNI